MSSNKIYEYKKAWNLLRVQGQKYNQYESLNLKQNAIKMIDSQYNGLIWLLIVIKFIYAGENQIITPQDELER